jgi:hypothetical protein
MDKLHLPAEKSRMVKKWDTCPGATGQMHLEVGGRFLYNIASWQLKFTAQNKLPEVSQ